MNFSSKILEEAVNQISKLPGVGKKTALRYAMYFIKNDQDVAIDISKSILSLKTDLIRCNICHNLADFPTCSICSDKNRDNGIICVVEDVQDVVSLENTHQFRGKYHILGGVISPIDGVGPSSLFIQSLIDRVQNGEIKELLFALSATTEGDTTAFYISKQLKDSNIQFTALSRGISVGGELEYADEITLGKSIQNRVPYHF